MGRDASPDSISILGVSEVDSLPLSAGHGTDEFEAAPIIGPLAVSH